MCTFRPPAVAVITGRWHQFLICGDNRWVQPKICGYPHPCLFMVDDERSDLYGIIYSLYHVYLLHKPYQYVSAKKHLRRTGGLVDLLATEDEKEVALQGLDGTRLSIRHQDKRPTSSEEAISFLRSIYLWSMMREATCTVSYIRCTMCISFINLTYQQRNI